MRGGLAVTTLVATSFFARAAHAQSDQAVRACLLLRSPAECGIAPDDLAAAPGDALNTEAMRPGLARLKRSPGASPPTLVIGEHTLIQNTREVYALPFAYKPWKWLDVGGEVPGIRQRLPESTIYALGDVSGNANFTYASDDDELNLRGYAAVKLPTGSTTAGTGSGQLDLLALTDVYWHPKRFAFEAHGLFRHNGDRQRGDLGQGSLSVDWIVPVGSWVDIHVHGRALGHVESAAPDGSHGTRASLAGVFGVYPSFLNFGVGEILVSAPLVAGGGASRAWSITAGLTKPF